MYSPVNRQSPKKCIAMGSDPMAHFYWLDTASLPEEQHHARLDILPRRAICREGRFRHRIMRRLHPVRRTRNGRDAHLVNAAGEDT